MSYLTVNDTVSIIDTKIHDFLCNFPDDHPYQIALSVPYFYQMLKTKILGELPNHNYGIGEEMKDNLSYSSKLGLSLEKQLIEETIWLFIPNLIHDVHHQKAISQTLPTFWWIKVHTIIPCITYFFGPFDSWAEAKENYWGYIEDLKTENAVGITFEFQDKNPEVLTVTDSPAELRQDLQTLWQYICKYQTQNTPRQVPNEKLLDFLPGNYLTTDLQGIIQNVNANVCQLLNLVPQEMVGKSLNFFVPQQQQDKFAHYLGLMQHHAKSSTKIPCWSMALRTAETDLINIDVETRLYKNSQGVNLGWYWLLHNTTQLYIVSEQNHYDSRHDLLTRLPNRRSLFEFLHELIKDRQTDNSKLFSLLLLDLNNFKAVNDKFGHPFGDEVLKAIAARLLSCVRHQDKVARLGGDEFAIILEAMNSPQEAKDCAYRIHHALSHPLQIANRQITVGSSIGIVISNSQNLDCDHLFYCADMAMYESKRNVSPFVIFDNGNSEMLKLEKQLHAQVSSFILREKSDGSIPLLPSSL